MIDLCGKYLGESFRRIVYEHKDNPSLVIKFQKKPEDDHNYVEWMNWQTLKDTPKGEWLTPCVSITPDHRFLVQERVEVLDDAPSEVPSWIQVLGDWSFGGNKSKHWGLRNNKVVLIDFGDKEL